jgi:Flp pilus assembly protein TadG
VLSIIIEARGIAEMERFRVHKGQAIVEFIIALPILLLLITGAFDLGQVYYTKTVLTNAAREGAYYISYHPGDDATMINTAIHNEAYEAGISIGPGDWTTVPACCSAFPKGLPVVVTVSKPVNLNIFKYFAGPLTISSSATMLVQR